MVEFREAGLGDLSIIRAIAYETWPDTFGQIIPADQLTYMLDLVYNENALKKQILERGHKFILVEKDHHTLGFVSYEINYNTEPQLMIHKLYLLPVFQGISIGTKVLNLLSGIALGTNNKQLRLKVYFKNMKAIRFYKKHGFKSIGLEETDIGNNYSIFDNVMVKELRCKTKDC